nr:hypothetical protein [Tanacetum cinerariifolium]
MMIKKDPPLDQTGGPKDKKKEVSRTQSRQQSASESAYTEEPVQTTRQIEETPLP